MSMIDYDYSEAEVKYLMALESAKAALESETVPANAAYQAALKSAYSAYAESNPFRGGGAIAHRRLREARAVARQNFDAEIANALSIYETAVASANDALDAARAEAPDNAA